MVSTFIDNDPAGADIPGVDRHFYENQVPPSSPFRDNAFALATARAKDKARHELISAIRKADADARGDALIGIDVTGDLGAPDGTGGQALSRSIDGHDGAPLNDIKL